MRLTRRGRLVAALSGGAFLGLVALGLFWSTGGAPAPEAARQTTGLYGADTSATPAPAPGSAGAPESAAPELGQEVGSLEPAPEAIATDAPSDAAGRPPAATVVLSFLDWDAASGVDASGLVTGVVEDGGTCVLELRRDDVVLTARSPGSADAASTTCGRLMLPAGDVDAGLWQGTLSYESPTTSGASAPVALEVTAP